MADSRQKPSRTPPSDRPPTDGTTPRLRDQDVVKNEGLRGPVVRGGVESMAALWED
jgi:hypothetical protein